MSIEINYDPETEIMMCRLTGKIDIPLLKDFAASLQQLMKEHQCTRILNDCRDSDLALSAFDIHQIPAMASKAGLNPAIKRAIVNKTTPDDFSFFETVSANQMHQVKVFTDYDEAMKWLTADS